MDELKKLLFAAPYPDILFTNQKTKTFRVTGGENFIIGDKISLCYVDGEEFGRAIVVNKYKKRFEELVESDWAGHERFVSEKQMYDTYSAWERFEVGPKTELDVLVYKEFRLTGRVRTS